MERKCKLARKKSPQNVEIWIDSETFQEIFAYIGQDERHKNKFIDIANIILGNLNNRHLYRREDINKDAKDVTAMRFFVGQENDRIYCKETSRGDIKIVIMSVLHLHKETNELSQEEINIINTIAKYEYKFEEPRKQ